MAHTLNTTSLEALQAAPRHIRNICILAHVDHGKTTLTDCLICSNGIISAKLAGKVRYMDSTEDEQVRGITMKSSAISLLHHDAPYRDLKKELDTRAAKNNGESTTRNRVPYLVNLIDSPGHVDFSSDVSTAVRLSDGAIVVIDALEGVCIQTHAVLRQAWDEGVRPCLVLNKIDRLITELQLTPDEAYQQLQRILEQVNVIASSLFTAELMASLGNKTETNDSAATSTENVDDELTSRFESWAIELSEQQEKSIFFSPSKGNVVFASAFDGWAFSTDDFAGTYADKLGIDRSILRKALWGDFALKKSKDGSRKVVPLQKAGSKAKPMFVELVLNTLWKVYEGCLLDSTPQRVQKIVDRLGIDVPLREIQQKDDKSRLQSIVRRWLPVSRAVLGMVSRVLPSPVEAHAIRLRRLLPTGLQIEQEARALELQDENDASINPVAAHIERVRSCIENCDASDDAPCVVYVTKMVAVSRLSLPQIEPQDLETEWAKEAAPSNVLRMRMTDVNGVLQQCKHKFEVQTETQPVPAWYGDNGKTTADVLTHPNTLFRNGIIGNIGINGDPNEFAQRDEQDSDDDCHEDAYRSSSAGAGDTDDSETFVAFARVFSGCLRPDRPMYVLGPKYDPLRPMQDNGAHISQITQPLQLYMMMGRELVRLRRVPAGNVVGIAGLGSHILKTATLCSTPSCPSLVPMSFQTTPLVRVAIEPKSVTDIAALQKGLQLLNQADPSVEVSMSATGEMQLSALGELHLERCIKDLQTRFARIEVLVSPPIMNFRETIIKAFTPRPLTDEEINGPKEEIEMDTDARKLPQSDYNGDDPSASAINKGVSLPLTSSVWRPGIVVWPANGLTYATTPDGICTIVLQAVELPSNIRQLLESRPAAIREILARSQHYRNNMMSHKEGHTVIETSYARRFLRDLSTFSEEFGPEWTLRLQNLCSFGPRGCGPNILSSAPDARRSISHMQESGSSEASSVSNLKTRAPSLPVGSISLADSVETLLPSLWEQSATILGASDSLSSRETSLQKIDASATSTLRNSIVQGFQLATADGPLCAEPMWGVCFNLCDIIFHSSSASNESSVQGDNLQKLIQSMLFSVQHAQLMSLMRNACKAAFQTGDQRLVEAMYKCELQCSGGRGGGGEQLGKLYSVLSKRRGRVLAEDLMEGTSTFLVTALLPIVESFGFADDLRKQTSGAATSPQLVFNNWEIINVDPYYQPRTEEEKEEYGEMFHEGQFVNLAYKYIELVRQRKGLEVDRKIVVHAEKQRNLSRKK